MRRRAARLGENGIEPPAERVAAAAGTEERARRSSSRRWQAMGFPSGVPGIPDSIFLPENFVFPIFDYDWGPQFDEFNATGSADERAAADQARDQDDGADGRFRRQRARRRADGAARCAARRPISAGTSRRRGFHAAARCATTSAAWCRSPITKAQRIANERSAPVARGALWHARRLRRGGEARRRTTRRARATCSPAPQAAAMGAKCTTALPPGFPDDWAALVNQAMAATSSIDRLERAPAPLPARITAYGENTMHRTQLQPPFPRAHMFAERSTLRLAVAGALAAGLFAAGPVAEARTTKIDITSRTIAFGGHVFAGVGQYEKITGIASGEIDPNDPQNAVITDIRLAPVNANGHVEYQHNFYILKPLDLGKGAHKVMYEPPNRGGKTFQTLNRSSGGNDPGTTITDPVALDQFVPVAARLHDGVQRLGERPRRAYEHDGDGAFSGAARIRTARRSPARRTNTSSARAAVVRAHVSGRDAEPGERQRSDASRSPGRPAARSCPTSGWAYNATGTAIHLTTRQRQEFRRQRHLRVLVHREGPDAVTASGLAVVRDFNAFLRYATRTTSARPIRWPATLRGSTPKSPRSRAACPERLHASRVQPGRVRQEGVRRHAAMDRGRRRAQHELPLVADLAHESQSPGSAVSRGLVPVRQPDDVRSDLAGRPTAGT